jgi:hypothetical protein
MTDAEWVALSLDEKIAHTEAKLAEAEAQGFEMAAGMFALWLEDMKRERGDPP